MRHAGSIAHGSEPGACLPTCVAGFLNATLRGIFHPLAAVLWLLSPPHPGWSDTVNPPAADHENLQALVIADYSQCGHADVLLFTVLWQGRVGVMTQPPLIGWYPPHPGDRLSGGFLEEGVTEVRFLDKPETTHVRILKTGVPADQQGALRSEICAR